MSSFARKDGFETRDEAITYLGQVSWRFAQHLTMARSISPYLGYPPRTLFALKRHPHQQWLHMREIALHRLAVMGAQTGIYRLLRVVEAGLPTEDGTRVLPPRYAFLVIDFASRGGVFNPIPEGEASSVGLVFSHRFSSGWRTSFPGTISSHFPQNYQARRRQARLQATLSLLQ